MYEEKLLFKSKQPILFYVSFTIIFLNVIFLIIKKMPIEGFFIYPPIIALLLFLTFARYSCIIELYNNKLIIKYLFFWHKDKEINLEERFIIEIRKSYWSFNPSYNRVMHKGQVFYDTLYITKGNIKETIRINTRYGHFIKTILKLQDLPQYRKSEQDFTFVNN